MQDERSGSSADSIYKSNWPYFLLLDFLRSQFKTRPTSGNLKKKAKTSTLEDLSTGNMEITPTSGLSDEIRHIEESVIDSQEANESVLTEHDVSSAQGSSENTGKNFKEELLHPNSFKKSSIKNNNLTKLVQLEEKKLAILEGKRASKAIIDKPDEDMKFYESLLPHIKKINGVDKLLFRNEVQNLVIKYAYSNTNQESVSSDRTNHHSRPSTSISVYRSESSTPLTHEGDDVLDLDSWNTDDYPSYGQH